MVGGVWGGAALFLLLYLLLLLFGARIWP